MKKARTRNPDGVASQKPIALRLTKDERDQAEEISNRKNFSMSALARKAYLAGLPLVVNGSGAKSLAPAAVLDES